MTRNEFFAQLAHALQQLTESERNDILRDYQEYFVDAQQAGRSDAEIIATLGQPAQIAKQLTAHRQLNVAKQNLTFGTFIKATLAVIGLTFINLVFVLGPLLCIIALFLGIWVVSICLLVSPIMYLVIFLFRISVFEFGDIYTTMTAYDFPINVQQSAIQFIGSLSLVTCGIGLLCCVLLYSVSRWFIHLFIKYMQLNITLVPGSK